MVGGRILISSQVEMYIKIKVSLSKTQNLKSYTEIVAVYGYMLKSLTFFIISEMFLYMQTFFLLR